jgi:ornithine cyclodeaminase/alanine dehydrogenase-like protein (mu-crystallin family)
MPLYLTEQQVSELLTPADAITAVEACFDRLARGVIDNPARVRVEVPGGVFAVMPCVDHELGYAGLKTYLWLQVGTPFLVVLLSLEHGQLEAVIEADTLGQLRTAAASAVAAKHLARAEARTLGVIGCGRQAAAHVAALRTALPSLDRVLVHCRDAARLAAFCREHGCEQAGSGREAGACDIVVTATTAEKPVLQGEWLRDGALVCAVGANAPGARELDDEVLRRAAFVCTDARSHAQLEAGDLIGPVERGLIGWPAVQELQDVVAGRLRGRASDDAITLFKSNGLAAWDLAAAARVVELAR